MKKLKPGTSEIGPIAKKVLSDLNKTVNRKMVNLSTFRNSKVHSENLEKTILSEKSLSGYDPIHGVYVYAQNMISVLAEQLAGLRALSRLTNAYVDAEEEYMPSGPPMSPLTRSYFYCWGFFDLCAGVKKESFGTVAINLCKRLNVDAGMIRVYEHMQNSRMGFYVHEGVSGKFVHLREIITQKQWKVIVPAEYLGRPGEIWFARIMPEPFPELGYGYSVVFTTPYIITEQRNENFIPSSEESWVSFFERNHDKTKITEKERSYERLMKYGLDRHYWNEFVFEGYVNYKREMIMLAGFPDIPLSRPHSRESQNKREFMGNSLLNYFKKVKKND